MKVRINGDHCSGHGRCYTLAPALIDLDDAGFPVPVDTEISVPVDAEETANLIVGSCPEGAITVV